MTAPEDDLADVIADEKYQRAREDAVEKKAPLQLLTNSRMRTFRQCARLHDLRYNRGWTPVKESEALRFGTLMHQGLEAWWLCVQNANAALDLVLENALSVVVGNAADPFEGVRAEELLRGYHARWFPSVDDYEVLGVETEFRAPLLNPTTWQPSRTWRLAGKMDGLVRRRSNRRILVREGKTTVEEIKTDDEHYWSTLALDHQISMYIIGAESLGHHVDECMYDVIRKVRLVPYKETPDEAKKFTKAGVLYANQHDHDETVEEYRVRVRAEIESDPERYFQRRSIPRTESQIRDFMMDAWQQARTMREQQLDGYSVRNPEACHRFGTCGFWNLCSTGGSPEDYPSDYVHIENVHRELSCQASPSTGEVGDTGDSL